MQFAGIGPAACGHNSLLRSSRVRLTSADVTHRKTNLDATGACLLTSPLAVGDHCVVGAVDSAPARFFRGSSTVCIVGSYPTSESGFQRFPLVPDKSNADADLSLIVYSAACKAGYLLDVCFSGAFSLANSPTSLFLFLS